MPVTFSILFSPDIIGVISHVRPFDYASPTSPNKLRIIKILNLEEQTQEIRLWGQHGETFDEEAVLEKSKEGIVVAIFAGVTAVEFLGNLHASSTSATKIYINLDIDEVKNYQTSYQWKPPPLQQQLPQVVRLSPIQAAGKLYTLDQISNMPSSSFQEGATYSTFAKVQSIVASAKWYYKGCKHCDKGYNNISDTSTCLCENSYPKPLYKLPITLIDDSGNLDAIAFTNVAEQLVELNAYQASQNMKIDPEEQVATLDKAIGKSRLFHIRMKVDSSSRFPISYVIKRSFPVENLQTLPSTKTPPGKEVISYPSSSINIQSPVSHTPEDSENTTPSFEEPSATDTEKNKKNNSQVKRNLQFPDEDTTSKDNSSKKTSKKGKKS